MAAVATTAIIVSVADHQYHYDNGVYYEEQSSGGYKVVPAPVGVTVSSIPSGYTTINVDGTEYYYYGGAFYTKVSKSYTVVAPPVGATVTKLPEGATEKTVDGQKYMVYDNTYYQPTSENGQDAYVVTDKK